MLKVKGLISIKVGVASLKVYLCTLRIEQIGDKDLTDSKMIVPNLRLYQFILITYLK